MPPTALPPLPDAPLAPPLPPLPPPPPWSLPDAPPWPPGAPWPPLPPSPPLPPVAEPLMRRVLEREEGARGVEDAANRMPPDVPAPPGPPEPPLPALPPGPLSLLPPEPPPAPSPPSPPLAPLPATDEPMIVSRASVRSPEFWTAPSASAPGWVAERHCRRPRRFGRWFPLRPPRFALRPRPRHLRGGPESQPRHHCRIWSYSRAWRLRPR